MSRCVYCHKRLWPWQPTGHRLMPPMHRACSEAYFQDRLAFYREFPALSRDRSFYELVLLCPASLTQAFLDVRDSVRPR